MVSTILLFLISCIFLVLSGGWLVKLLVKIAAHLRLGKFVVGFILMAFATSIPELFVGINSALAENPSLSLGNVIGSNIVTLSLVMGIATLLGRGIKVKSTNIKTDCTMMLIISSIPVCLMLFDQDLSRFDGLILVSIFLFYIIHLIKERRRKTPFEKYERKHFIINIFLFILGVGVLFLSAHFVVEYGTKLAIELHLPEIMIGLFFIAIGTSLPELVFEIRAVLARKADLALGDAMGSVVCNSTLVLGVTALICPITGRFDIFLTSAMFMVFVAFLFTMLIRRKSCLTVRDAIILIFLYILFIFFEFSFQ